MTKAFLVASIAIAAASALVACATDDTAASPTVPAPSGAREAGVADSASPPVADTGAPDAAPSLCDGGALLAAKWDFAVSANDGGPGTGQQLAIKVNGCVQWTNDESPATPHSVLSTGDAGFTFRTATLTGTNLVSAPIQFPKAGTFTYECGIHGSMMTGAVTVTP